MFSAEQVRECLPPRDENSHKGNFGYIALVGGSLPYSGAIRLASMANCAMRSGAGVVTIAAPMCICREIVPRILESTIYPLKDDGKYFVFDEEEFSGLCSRYHVIAFGMGIGLCESTVKAMEYLLKNYSGILIVDADGLNAMAQIERELISSTKARLILTPHVKELSRLSGQTVADIAAEPVKSACELAKALKAIVLLKGHITTVTDGSESFQIDRGCAGMATAGSGDVLSGIIAAICASNKNNLLKAVASAAYINGLAGEIAQSRNGQISMIASDTASAVKDAILQIVNKVN